MGPVGPPRPRPGGTWVALKKQSPCGAERCMTGSQERWRRLPMAYGGGAELLAGVEGMLAGLEETHWPAIRWSTLAQPTLFLGSSQRLEEVDLAAAFAADVAVHKRRS